MRGIVADITNQTGSTDKTTNQNQAGGSSPWDEPIDLPEQPEEKSQGPQIIGSLDSGTEQSIKQEKPVPFNIPEEVVEEKVGKKVPAEEVMGRDKPIFGDPLNGAEKNTANKKVESISIAPNNGTNIINQKVKSDARDISRSTNTENLQIHKIEKADDVAAQISDDRKPIAKPEIIAKPIEDSSRKQADNLTNDSLNNLKKFNTAVSPAPSQPNNAPAQISLDAKKTNSEKNTESGISELILGGNAKDDDSLNENKGEMQKPPVAKTDVSIAAQPEPKPLSDKKDDQQGEKGISELLLGDEADPFADPFSDGVDINNTPLPDNSLNSVSTKGNSGATGKEANNSAKTNMPPQQTARRAFDIAPPPDKAPVQSPLNTEKNIPAKSAVTPQAASQPIVQNTPVAQKKSSFLSRINPFSKKKKSSDMPGANIGNKPTPAVATANAANPTPAPQNLMPNAPRKTAFKLSPKFSIVFSLLFLLAGSIYLTETGMVSFGIENIYGIVGLEKIWGGLPKSSESALAIAVSKGQEHLNFKFKGSFSATIDKTKKSSVTSPFISYGRPVQPLADIMNSASQNASLAQYDYYGDSTTDDTSSDYYSSDASSDSTDSSASTSSSSTSSTSSTSSSGSTATDSDINSPTPSETDTTSATESTNSTAITETTTKQIELEITGDSNDKNISSEMVVKPLVGSDKYIDLMSNNGSLYVKSDDLKFNDKAQSGKWLAYKFSGFETENTFASFLNLNTNSGFSIIGSRQANEKLSDGSRAYKYKIENMEIGDTFTNLGISKEMVQSINGNIWIGVRDHLIHKISLEINPSVSAGFSKISCDLEFYDYDISNEITIPAFDNIITIENANTDQNTNSVDTSSTAVTSTSNNVPASSSSSSTNTSVGNQRSATDSQRQSDLLSIKSALQSYKDRYGYYPKSSSFENVGLSTGILNRTLIPRYISSLPADPKAAEGWWYGYKSDGKSFTLSARFENINDSEVTKVGSVYLHYVYGN